MISLVVFLLFVLISSIASTSDIKERNNVFDESLSYGGDNMGKAGADEEFYIYYGRVF